MKQKLVNKHIIRAISLGLTAVMASSPVTALASELEQLPEEEKKVEDNTQSQSDFVQSVEVVQEQLAEAENSISGTTTETTRVEVDDTAEKERVILPSTEEVITETPSAMEAAGNPVLQEEAATLEKDGAEYEVSYDASIAEPSVQQNTGSANSELNEAQISLENAVIQEAAAAGKGEVAESQIGKAQEAVEEAEAANSEVETAEEALEQAVEAAKATTTKEEADAAMETVEEAVKTVEEAEVKAQEAVEAAQTQLEAAQKEADAAKANYQTAKTSLGASKEQVAQAHAEMVKAEEKASALKKEVDSREKDYEKALQLKRLYESMKEVAAKEKPTSDYISAGQKEEYSSDFGREKASSEYWKASYDYFEAYLNYVYGSEKDFTAHWTSKGEHFAKNNVYEITYTNEAGENVTKYFNYHLTGENGDISIYEKKSQEVYGEENYQVAATDVVLETEDGKYVIKKDDAVKVDEFDYLTEFKKSFVNDEKLTLDENSTFVEYTLTDILVADKNGDQVRDIKTETGVDSQQKLEKLVEGLTETQYLELTYRYPGSSPMVIEVNSGVNVATLINEIFRSYLGNNTITAVVKEKCSTQKAVVETIRGNYTLEYSKEEFISVDKFKDVPSLSARKNDIKGLVEDKMKSFGGTASNLKIEEKRDEITGEILGYTYTYDVVAKRIGINLEERTYTATTYNTKSDVLMERKDTSQDQKILDAMNAAAAYREKQDAAAVALAAVKEAKADVEKAQQQLKELKINDAKFEQALEKLEAAKGKLVKAQEDLKEVQEEVKETKEEYEKVKEELEEKSYPDKPGTEPNPENGTGENNDDDLKDVPKEEGGNSSDDNKEKKPENSSEDGNRLPDRTPARQPVTQPQNEQNPTSGNSGNNNTQPIPNGNNLPENTQDTVTLQQEDASTNLQQNNNTSANNIQDAVLVAAADEEVPLGGDLSQMIGEEQLEEDGQTTLTQLEEEAVPLANTTLPKENMSWWWLLIVALLGATGYKMYEKYQEKKELKEEK